METNVHSMPKPLKKTTILSSPTECDDVEMEEAKANDSQPVGTYFYIPTRQLC